MNPVSRITLSGVREEKQQARESVAERAYRIDERLAEVQAFLPHLSTTPLALLDRKVKHGASLTFEEAFCGMCFIVAATNLHFYDATRDAFEAACGTKFPAEKALASGTAFAQLMAAKESFSELTPEEIAGMAAAGMLDPVLRMNIGAAIETSGMGGDVGFVTNGVTRKTINLSTLSSLVLAAFGITSVKHGSYSNTSAVGSTEAIELFGARTAHASSEAAHDVFANSGYAFLDAHWCKTIHDLSHLIMIETINHVVGPMTPPLASSQPITKLMGVNEKVHPETVARAYTILHQRAIQRMGGVAIVTGLDAMGIGVNPKDHQAVKAHSILDEVSPHASVVSFAQGGEFLGTFLLTPSDFDMEVCACEVQVANTKDHIQRANVAALKGTNPALANYLAMNAALGMFAACYLYLPDAINARGPNPLYLRKCFRACRNLIAEGKAWGILEKYVTATGGSFIFPR